ncbi:MAG: hypothetical protein R3A52_12005 [Polyangiales bacterium]
MSKTYRVKLGAVTGESSDRRKVVCPKLVPEMGEILGEALTRRGWVVDAESKRATKRDGAVTASLDLDDPTLELRASLSEEVIGQSYEPNDNDALGTAKAKADAEAQRIVATKRVKRAAESLIASREAGVRDDVLGAVKEALVEALKRKAATLGRVESVVQGTDAQGRAVTTIKVEV